MWNPMLPDCRSFTLSDCRAFMLPDWVSLYHQIIATRFLSNLGRILKKQRHGILLEGFIQVNSGEKLKNKAIKGVFRSDLSIQVLCYWIGATELGMATTGILPRWECTPNIQGSFGLMIWNEDNLISLKLGRDQVKEELIFYFYTQPLSSGYMETNVQISSTTEVKNT